MSVNGGAVRRGMLSGLQSLFNIDLVRWFFSQIAIHLG